MRLPVTSSGAERRMGVIPPVQTPNLPIALAHTVPVANVPENERVAPKWSHTFTGASKANL